VATAPTTATATSGATPTPGGATAASCDSSGFITASQGASNSGPGSVWYAYVLAYSGAEPCMLSGYPLVTLADSSGSLGTNETEQAFLPDPSTGGIVSLPDSPVIVSTGVSASFDVQYDVTPTAGETCPQASELQIILPGVAGTIDAPATIAPCGGDIDVSPVQAGTALAA
jgi:hypothetical protein